VVKPFRQLPFRDVPESPRRPHDYDATRGEDVTLQSAPFGTVRLHVRRAGHGPPLLLIHGLMTSSYSWRYVVKELSEHFEIIAPDLPGCGNSPPLPDRSHDAASLATLIGELQTALNIRGCKAIGNSLGGLLCLHLLQQQPNAFERLVLIHPPFIPSVGNRALNLVFKLPGTRALLRTLVHRDPVKWGFKWVHYWDESLKSLEEARTYGEPLSTREGVASFARYLTEPVHPGAMTAFAKELEKNPPRIPIQLLYARRDPIVPASTGPKLAAALPNARFVWLEDTSHFAHVDTPELVLRHAVPFLLGVV
jgi:pimeloyl-ACP methyl ester carboxylesterase